MSKGNFLGDLLDLVKCTGQEASVTVDPCVWYYYHTAFLMRHKCNLDDYSEVQYKKERFI